MTDLCFTPQEDDTTETTTITTLKYNTDNEYREKRRAYYREAYHRKKAEKAKIEETEESREQDRIKAEEVSKRRREWYLKKKLKITEREANIQRLCTTGKIVVQF